MNKLAISSFLVILFFNSSAQHYNNFKVSVYCRAYEVKQMADTTNYLKPDSRLLKISLYK